MIKTIPLLVALAIGTLGPSKCDRQIVASSDTACAVIRETLYPDGKFNLTDSEVDALSEANQIKLDSVKRYYRNRCLKKGDS